MWTSFFGSFSATKILMSFVAAEGGGDIGAAGGVTPRDAPACGGPEWTEEAKGCGKPSFSATHRKMRCCSSDLKSLMASTTARTASRSSFGVFMVLLKLMINEKEHFCFGVLDWLWIQRIRRFDEGRRVVACGKLGRELICDSVSTPHLGRIPEGA